MTSSVRNTLVGQPLDLPAINIARGRSEGVPGLNQARQQFFTALLQASFPLKSGPDPELALEALIDATQMLKEHFEQELEELRLEQAE